MADIDRTQAGVPHPGPPSPHAAASRRRPGKAQFHAIDLPAAPPASARELRLMTVRSEGQFNTVVYEEEDIYRGQERRDVILMNPADIAPARPARRSARRPCAARPARCAASLVRAVRRPRRQRA